MTSFAISGFQPAKSNADRAKQIFEVFDSIEEAMTAGERMLKNGCNDVSLWQHKANPQLRTLIDWNDPANPNSKVTYSNTDRVNREELQEHQQ